MKKFIVIYHAPLEATKQAANSSPEEMKEGMKPWMAWAEKCGDGLIDMGTPLGNGQAVTSEGTAPSDKEVVGYSILQAEDMDGAVAMLKDHPHLKWNEGCAIEVHEALPLPGS
jgi:hypothetical protein